MIALRGAYVGNLFFQLWSDDIEVTKVECGENIRVKLKGVEEADVSSGFVLCDPNNPIKSCKIFDAQAKFDGLYIFISVVLY